MNAQMGVLADEVTRLDIALQETRAQLQQEQARVAELQARLGGGSSGASVAGADYSAVASEPYSGIYRTPSGFELQASSIQKALKAAGYYQGQVDGKIGPDTREAVRNFQRDNGLTPDGIVGKTTWSRLKTHLGE
jgi:peptidoglycan hydrolase-like protein with peptidoglycan-binding domain